MRNDLPSMNPGKAMAQASHASNQMVKEHGDSPACKEWQSQTKHGFGTVIVLGATIEQITECYNQTRENVRVGQVVDKTYPYIVTKEIAGLIPSELDTDKRACLDNKSMVLFRAATTCAYFLGTKEDLQPILGHLNLHP